MGAVAPLVKLGAPKSAAAAVLPARLKAKVVGTLLALESVTVCVRLPPSVTLASVTLATVGAPSLSTMVPTAATPPTERSTVSSGSSVVSLEVG